MLFRRVGRLCVDNRKRVIRKVWNKVLEKKRSQVPILGQRYTVNILFNGTVIHLKDSFRQRTNLWTATEYIRWPHTKTSVTFSRGQLKNSSNLSGFSLVRNGLWSYQLELMEYRLESSLQLSVVPWCTIGCAPLSNLISLRMYCWYQNGFSAKSQ